MSSDGQSTDGSGRKMWRLERVWTHRDTDRTIHHIKAMGKQEAERRLERLEYDGETDDLGNEIESQAGTPLHVHVNRSMKTDTDRSEGTDE